MVKYLIEKDGYYIGKTTTTQGSGYHFYLTAYRDGFDSVMEAQLFYEHNISDKDTVLSIKSVNVNAYTYRQLQKS